MIFYHYAQAAGLRSLIPDGTEALPGLAFTSEASTGIYRPGAARMGFSVTGTEIFELNKTTGAVIQSGYSLGIKSSVDPTKQVTVKFNGANTIANFVIPDAQGTPVLFAMDAAGDTATPESYSVAQAGNYIPKRDSNGNLRQNNFSSLWSSAAAPAGGTLAAGSALWQEVTGVGASTLNLPNATTYLQKGGEFCFVNSSSGALTVYKNDGITVQATVAAGAAIRVVCTDISAANGTWTNLPIIPSGLTTGVLHFTTGGAVTSSTVSNSDMSNMAAYTVKGNATSAAAAPSDMTLSQLANLLILPCVRTFTSGSSTYYPSRAFVCTGVATAPTSGATYTNNGITFTVVQSSSDKTLVYAYGNGTPTSSGTLVKTAGTGDANITFVQYADARKLNIKMVGGGGGGSGGGTSGWGVGASNGGDTTFGTATAGGGTKGPVPFAAGGAGGSATNGTGWGGIGIAGRSGQSGNISSYFGDSNSYVSTGGIGGSAPYFGGGAWGGTYVSGAATASSYGSGGGGGSGGNPGSVTYGGNGGGSGGFIDAVINNPSSSYSYSVGAAGPAGTAGAGANATAGGAGAAGVIIIVEEWQ